MGVWASNTYNPESDIPDLVGKVALVTGANRGIGLRTVQQLARHGAKVYMGSRDESKATEAIALLAAEGMGKGSVVWLDLNLTSPKSVKKAAEEFLRKETRLDILVNNAAMSPKSSVHHDIDSKEPISETMATNHLGHFILTTMLLDVLKRTATLPGTDVRIVTVSTIVIKMSPAVKWTDMSVWRAKPGNQSKIATAQAYSTSKLAGYLFVRELQDRLVAEGSSILSIAVHPGAVSTAGADRFLSYHIPGFALFRPLFRFIRLTEAEGSYNTLLAATWKDVRENETEWRGAFAKPYGVIEKLGFKGSWSIESQKELWVTTEEIARKNVE